MKITFDTESEILYIKLNDENIASSREIEGEVVINFNDKFEIIGLQLLDPFAWHREDYKKYSFPNQLLDAIDFWLENINL